MDIQSCTEQGENDAVFGPSGKIMCPSNVGLPKYCKY